MMRRPHFSVITFFLTLLFGQSEINTIIRNLKVNINSLQNFLFTRYLIIGSNHRPFSLFSLVKIYDI